LNTPKRTAKASNRRKKGVLSAAAKNAEAQKGRNMSTSPSKQTHQTTNTSEVIKNGAMLVGDVAILPGVSLLAEGNLKSGTLHVVGGLLARAVFGPIGWVAVAADAYTKSVTGKNIFDHFFRVEKVHD
jgi:hypothetical protein